MGGNVMLSALVGAIAALLVDLGKRKIARLFDRTSRLEARRDEDLRLIEDVTFQVRDIATHYWSEVMGPAADQKAAAAIVGRITFISRLIDELFDGNDHMLIRLHEAINEFDVSCTAGDFGGKGRAPSPDQCRSIEITAYTLVHLARSMRRRLK